MTQRLRIAILTGMFRQDSPSRFASSFSVQLVLRGPALEASIKHLHCQSAQLRTDKHLR